MAARTPQQIANEREDKIIAIEQLAREIRARRLDKVWLSKTADTEVRRVVQGVNGPLLEALAKSAQYDDRAVINLLRDGAPVVGPLHVAGIGKPLEPDMKMSIEELRAERVRRNKEVLHSLKEDVHSAELWQSCIDDARKGRMRPFKFALRQCTWRQRPFHHVPVQSKADSQMVL